jgi:hypothetical protein
MAALNESPGRRRCGEVGRRHSPKDAAADTPVARTQPKDTAAEAPVADTAERRRYGPRTARAVRYPSARAFSAATHSRCTGKQNLSRQC